jgi:hypothetical protein
MAAKEVTLPDIGKVKLYKRKGSRGIRLTMSHDNYVRVTMPTWLPYATAVTFVSSKRAWVVQHQVQSHIFKHGEAIGKAHRLTFVQKIEVARPTVRIVDNEIRVQHPANLPQHHTFSQTAAKRGALRALKKESIKLLPQRVELLANKHGFSYDRLSVRPMKSRWGSCSHQKNITLNIFLMQLPWELIDYVIVHELTHTKALNHGANFWNILETYVPDAKQKRQALHRYRPSF